MKKYFVLLFCISLSFVSFAQLDFSAGGLVSAPLFNFDKNHYSNGWGGKFGSRLEKNYSNGFYVNGNFTGKRYGDFNTPNYILSNTGFKEVDFSIKLGKDLVSKGWNLKYSNYNLEPGILKA